MTDRTVQLRKEYLLTIVKNLSVPLLTNLLSNIYSILSYKLLDCINILELLKVLSPLFGDQSLSSKQCFKNISNELHALRICIEFSI